MNKAKRWRNTLLGLGVGIGAVAPTSGAGAAEAVRGSFGALADGTRVDAVTLTNHAGISVRIIALGASIQSLLVPDAHGHPGDVVLGFDTAQEYLDGHDYFGATVGRFANRIANGRFELDGKTYTLAGNDNGNHLHGGKRGFDKMLWTIDSATSGEMAVAVLSHVSPDGEEGYPGTLTVTATFSLDDHGTLRVDYRATTDKPTLVNISNHSYFNLSGSGAGTTALNHVLQLNAARYTPVDEHLIPTGELRDVGGSPFDFRTPTAIDERVRDGREAQIRYGRGYDHNFVLEPPTGALRWAVRLRDPQSGRRLEMLTTAPGVQFYSGNFLNSTVSGKGHVLYREGDALAFEPQVFPDAPNHVQFPTARLDPGGTYLNRIEYRFSAR